MANPMHRRSPRELHCRSVLPPAARPAAETELELREQLRCLAEHRPRHDEVAHATSAWSRRNRPGPPRRPEDDPYINIHDRRSPTAPMSLKSRLSVGCRAGQERLPLARFRSRSRNSDDVATSLQIDTGAEVIGRRRALLHRRAYVVAAASSTHQFAEERGQNGSGAPRIRGRRRGLPGRGPSPARLGYRRLSITVRSQRTPRRAVTSSCLGRARTGIRCSGRPRRRPPPHAGSRHHFRRTRTSS